MRPGLALLRAAVLVYRRFVSGRGPMRMVGCSFAACESCSAYGLRAIECAPHSLAALRRIRGRLRRCRDLALYRLYKHERELLAWGPDYELDDELDAALLRADELPITRWSVLDAARQLAAYRGQWTLAVTLVEQRDACLPLRPPSAPQLLVRRAPRLRAHLRLRLHLELLALTSLAALAAWLLPLVPALAFALVSSVHASVVIARSLQRQRRFARQIAAARFMTCDRAQLPVPQQG